MKQRTRTCDSCPLASDLGDALRPGGLDLTKRVLQIAGIGESSEVLDIACGTGMTALFIAEQYHSGVVGIDLSQKMVVSSHTRIKGMELELSHRVRFVLCTAEDLPLADSTFDTVTCECSFTLVDSKRVAEEMRRVLKPGGKALITNIFLREGVNERRTLTPLTHCMATAKPLGEQVDFLKQAGFCDVYTEDHSQVINELALRMMMKLGWSKKFPDKASETPPAQPTKPFKYGYAMIVGVK